MELSDFERRIASLAPRAWPEDRDNPHLADCLIARLTEETGELAQAVRLLAGPRPGRPGEMAGNIEQVEDELGDVMFVVARIAIATGANLESGVRRTVAKIERRIRDAADHSTEHVAHEAIQQALDDPNDGYVWVPCDTWEALVSALQGEVEKR